MELKGDLGKEKSQDLLAQLNHNPLPANFAVKADDASNLAAVRASVTRASSPSIVSWLPRSRIEQRRRSRGRTCWSPGTRTWTFKTYDGEDETSTNLAPRW